MTNTSKGLLITSIGVLIISLESLLIRFANIDVFTFSFYLGIFMFISMATALMVKQRDVIKKITTTSFPILILCAILMGSSNIFFISGIIHTTVANVVLIFGTAALFSSFFAFLIYKEKITKNILIASFFMIIGLLIIFKDELEMGNMTGNIYALLSVSSFALAFVFLVRYSEINRFVLTAVIGLSMIIISFFLSDSLYIDLNTLRIVAFMGLFVTPVARVLISSGTRFISASEIGLLMIIETIMAPIWVWIFLKEIPSSNTFIGGGIILLTLIINSLYTLKKNKI